MIKQFNIKVYKVGKIKIVSKLLGLALLFLSSFDFVSAQESVPNKIQNDLETYTQQHLQEKLFLHLAKNVYLSNEICWFKIYNVDAFYHLPIGISKIAYVELIDTKNNPVVQSKIAIAAGAGTGSIQIPLHLPTGSYTLRAYTNWMKNSSTQFFFEKPITIINTVEKLEPIITAKKEEVGVQFFPEGGNLVSGLESTIAFHVTNQYGKGVNGTGTIVNENNDTITSFSTLKYGLGKFNLKPTKEHTYKAILNLADGKVIKQSLPFISKTGWVLHLENNKSSSLQIKIEGISVPNDTIYLLVHTRGIVKTVQSGAMQNGSAAFIIDKNMLGDGISTFTLFDQHKQPVCERLYFKQPEKVLDLGLKIESSIYEFRKKVNVEVTTHNEVGQEVPANMSMAVYKIDSLQPIDPMDIKSYLLLSSDLVGAVEMPNSYFNPAALSNEEAIDNLMLTHGWRRFSWEQINENKKPYFEFIPELAGHIINGKISNNNLPAKDKAVFVSIPGLNTQFKSTISDELGKIKFELRDFYNHGQIIVQVDSPQKNNSKIEISSPFSSSFSNKILLTPIPFAQINNNALAEHHVANVVLNNYKKEDLHQFILPTIDTNAFYYHPDRVYFLDKFVRFTTLEEVIREYVLPLSLTKRNGQFHLNVYDDANKFFDTPPLVLLDGVIVADLNKLFDYDPLKIKKLEIVSRTYYLGNLTFNGIVNFTTYNGKSEGYEYDPHALVLDYEGLQQQREFSAPLYETQKEIDNRLPDFRNVLYWSPSVNTSSTGKKSVFFYTSDVAGKYVIVLQGMTSAGQLGSTQLPFEIKAH